MEYETAAIYQEIIQELIYKVPEHQELVQKRLFQLGFSDEEKYYVVLIRKAGRQDIDRRALKSLLSTDIYTCDAGAAAILHTLWRKNLWLSSIPRFEDYLKTANLRSGLSKGFHGITKVSIAVTQAEYATHCMMDHNCPCRINSFRSNSTIAYLLETCAAVNPHVYDMCCHPVLKKIMEYDEKNTPTILMWSLPTSPQTNP